MKGDPVIFRTQGKLPVRTTEVERCCAVIDVFCAECPCDVFCKTLAMVIKASSSTCDIICQGPTA